MNKSAFYQALAEQHGTPLLVLDCTKVAAQYHRLQNALPTVRLYYAIKALPHPAVLMTLKTLAAGFDIASHGEIELLRACQISPTQTIHTHPIKTEAEIKNTLRFGCKTFVVDNPAEIEKFQPYRDQVNLLLRISFRSQSAVVDLSKKFGCQPEEALGLMQKAHQLKLNITGISFHVGSQSLDATPMTAAIKTCRKLIHQAEKQGMSLSLLDIGGGFPVSYQVNMPEIEDYCSPIVAALATLPQHIQVVAEPGRFLVAPAMEAICRIIGKAQRGNQTWFYLDDGVYGAFSGQIYDHANYPIYPINHQPASVSAVLAGPTCDSIDVIAENINFPDLAIGELIVGQMMGAYTLASATTFNGLPLPKVLVYHASSGDSPTIKKIDCNNQTPSHLIT